MSDRIARIALTSGEPAGIGPDICIALAQTAHAADLTVFADPELLAARARQLNLPLSLIPAGAAAPQTAGRLRIEPVKARTASHAGRLDPANAP